MTTWQPIETAPKDGTRVLLWDGSMMYVGAWYRITGYHPSPFFCWCLASDLDGEFPAHGYQDSPETLDPSHWQPLPAPPEPTP